MTPGTLTLTDGGLVLTVDYGAGSLTWSDPEEPSLTVPVLGSTVEYVKPRPSPGLVAIGGPITYSGSIRMHSSGPLNLNLGRPKPPRYDLTYTGPGGSILIRNATLRVNNKPPRPYIRPLKRRQHHRVVEARRAWTGSVFDVQIVGEKA